MSDVRKYTNKLYALMDEGAIDPRDIAEMCLSYMSEADVADMCRVNDVFLDEEDDDH